MSEKCNRELRNFYFSGLLKWQTWEDFRRRGIGRALVEAVATRAAAFSPRELVTLTFTPEFFASLGFVEVPKTKIMHKLYTGCINCTKHADPFTCPEKAMIRRVRERNL